jgi:hypothetical protein
LAIEENVVTVCGYFRLYCTYLGITVTDAWKLYRHSLGPRNEYKNISINQFSNILCKQLLHNTFSDLKTDDTHMPNLGSLNSQDPRSRTSLDFPDNIVQEDATTVSSLGGSSALSGNRQIGPGKAIPGTYKAPHDDATLVNYEIKTATGKGSYSETRTKRGKCRDKKCKRSTPMQCSYCDQHFCDFTSKHGRQCFLAHKERCIAIELDNHWHNLQNN